VQPVGHRRTPGLCKGATSFLGGDRISVPVAPAEGAVNPMNTYDLMQGMVYRHMSRQTDPYCVRVMSMLTINQLPSGYANESPRTFLGRPRRGFVAA
jgi:hypothetical protein